MQFIMGDNVSVNGKVMKSLQAFSGFDTRAFPRVIAGGYNHSSISDHL